MSLHKKLVISIFSILLGTGLAACGGGTNNDQGTSFLALGYFLIIEGEPEPVSSITVNLFSDNAPGFSDGTTISGNVAIGLENRLQNQFIRLERIDCTYSVPGANAGFAIPDDSFFSSTVLGAQPPGNIGGSSVFSTGIGSLTGAGGDADFESDDELVRPQVVFTTFPIASAELVQFLNLNGGSLPPPPFTLDSMCRGIGITQAGDVLTSNPVSFPVNFINSPNSTAQPNITGGTDGEDSEESFATTSANFSTTEESSETTSEDDGIESQLITTSETGVVETDDEEAATTTIVVPDAPTVSEPTFGSIFSGADADTDL